MHNVYSLQHAGLIALQCVCCIYFYSFWQPLTPISDCPYQQRMQGEGGGAVPTMVLIEDGNSLNVAHA